MLSSDDIVDLPSKEYEYVTNQMQHFLKETTKTKFKDNGFIYKRSVLLHGKPGCHAAGTEILMFNGSTKKVEEVQVGDLLMGPDSNPRKVLELAQGREPMVRITPVKGDPFVVNINHILHLTPSGTNSITKSPINIKFSDLLNESETFKERYKLTRTGVEFSNIQELPVNPYIIGSWLGDGTSRTLELTTQDLEIKEFWEKECQLRELNINPTKSQSSGKAITYSITASSFGKGCNSLRNEFQELNLLNNKHIPISYKTASRNNRLELLSGLIDTDGSLTCNGYDYISVSKQLANDVVYLVRSLGLAAYLTECQKGCTYKGEYKEGTYYRVSISGDCSIIPVKLERKKANPREQVKSVLRTGFTYEILPEDNYYGFSLDKDHLYLTGDFTIHHNTGKTVIVSRVVKEALKNNAVVLFNPNPGELQQIYEALEHTAPNKLTLVIFEEIDEIVVNASRASTFLSVLDGEIQKNNIIYLATTNYIDKVPLRFQRPGRFSSIVEVGFPSSQAREVYLTTKKVDPYALKTWVEKTEGFSIDELKETVLAVKCLDETLDTVVGRVKELKERGMESEGGKKKTDDEDDEDEPFSLIGKMVRSKR